MRTDYPMLYEKDSADRFAPTLIYPALRLTICFAFVLMQGLTNIMQIKTLQTTLRFEVAKLRARDPHIGEVEFDVGDPAKEMSSYRILSDTISNRHAAGVINRQIWMQTIPWLAIATDTRLYNTYLKYHSLIGTGDVNLHFILSEIPQLAAEIRAAADEKGHAFRNSGYWYEGRGGKLRAFGLGFVVNFATAPLMAWILSSLLGVPNTFGSWIALGIIGGLFSELGFSSLFHKYGNDLIAYRTGMKDPSVAENFILQKGIALAGQGFYLWRFPFTRGYFFAHDQLSEHFGRRPNGLPRGVVTLGAGLADAMVVTHEWLPTHLLGLMAMVFWPVVLIVDLLSGVIRWKKVRSPLNHSAAGGGISNSKSIADADISESQIHQLLEKAIAAGTIVSFDLSKPAGHYFSGTPEVQVRRLLESIQDHSVDAEDG